MTFSTLKSAVWDWWGPTNSAIAFLKSCAWQTRCFRVTQGAMLTSHHTRILSRKIRSRASLPIMMTLTHFWSSLKARSTGSYTSQTMRAICWHLLPPQISLRSKFQKWLRYGLGHWKREIFYICQGELCTKARQRWRISKVELTRFMWR